jgi:hypothetical protein
MTNQWPRSGLYATIGGVEYRCDAEPDDIDQCERLVGVTTRVEYRQLPCEVLSISPSGDVVLHHLGKDNSGARDRGFARVRPGYWTKTVNIYELGTVCERHEDLLFDHWREKYHPRWSATPNTAKYPGFRTGGHISTYVLYRGWSCQLKGFNDDGTANLYSFGTDPPGEWEQFDKGEYRTTVPVWELSGYYEERRAESFEAWREANFTRPGGGS